MRIFAILLFFVASAVANLIGLDPNGYIIFCPCMGRFGNQIDQFLGVLSFAKSLNRTLVLPNFIEFHHPKTKMISFENLFQVATIKKYTKVITTLEFKKNVMPNIWTPEMRYAFCWSPRKAIYDKSAEPGCHPKEGSPFGPYWDHIGVNFIGDQYFGDISGGFDTFQQGNKKQWIQKYNSSDFPVLAFSSAPAAFPSKSRVWNIQKYLKWSSRITENAKKYISEFLQKPFIGVHLRNDVDWMRACEHLNTQDNRPMFASEQCLGDNHHLGEITKEICYPSKETVIQKIVEQVGNINARSVFVSSDKDFMLHDINEALKPYEIEAKNLPTADIYTSLAILGRSDLFIGNCVSTFSHIVKRERDHGSQIAKPSTYFGIKSQRSKTIEL